MMTRRSLCLWPPLLWTSKSRLRRFVAFQGRSAATPPTTPISGADERDGAGAVRRGGGPLLRHDGGGIPGAGKAGEIPEGRGGDRPGEKQAVLQALMDRGLRRPGGGRLEGSGII